MKILTYIWFELTAQKAKKQEAMDPINALQNLTNQGTRNPMQPQMMGMGNQMGMANANNNPNVLQNLINVSLQLIYFNMFKHFTCSMNTCLR